MYQNQFNGVKVALCYICRYKYLQFYLVGCGTFEGYKKSIILSVLGKYSIRLAFFSPSLSVVMS